jgi:predicted AlkP superfamily pyrophosphatase or phosphodiesterase
MKFFPAVIIMVSGLSMAQETVPPARSKHALIFGIDGCRADALKLAVETGKAPHIAKLIQSGTVTWNAYAGGELGKPTQQITLSGPGWSSIFTAVWHDKHGVTDNTFRGANFTRYPNFIEHVRKALPEQDAASLVSWAPINEHIFKPTVEDGRCTCHTYVSSDPLMTEEKLIRNTILEVSSGSPSVVFCYQGLIDIVGHESGFSPEVPEYMEAIRVSDERIGQVIAAVNQRPGIANEDWLFIVCTDHGGIGKGHGGQSPEERVIPLVVSGGETPKGLVSEAVVGLIAVPATVMRHLGLAVDPAWGWVGKAFPETGADRQGATDPAPSSPL